MSEHAGADVARGAVPGPRSAPLPLPPGTVPAGPGDGDIAGEMEEAYWSVHDGAAARATVRQVLAPPIPPPVPSPHLSRRPSTMTPITPARPAAPEAEAA